MSTVNAGWRGPNIVKEGLVLYLDAASGTSYSPYTSGNTWRDISGNNYSGSLVNGPIYNSANGGTIVFDGVDDYVNVPSITWTPSSFTVFWITKPNTLADYNQVIGATNGWGSLTFHTTITGRVYVGIDIATRITPSDLTNQIVFTGTYQSFCFTYGSGVGSFYKNGAFLISKNMTTPLAWSGFNIGGASTNTINGNMGPVQIYNRALSAQEVLQNYNSVKSRFGL